MRLNCKNARKGIFLSIDAFLALTLAIILSISIAVFVFAPQAQLVELHQLGRDFLVLNFKHSAQLSESQFTALSGLNSSKKNFVGSSVIAYPKLCSLPGAGVPQCFLQQDAQGAQLVFNATVSP